MSPGFGHGPLGNFPMGKWDWAQQVLYDQLPELQTNTDKTQQNGILQSYVDGLKYSYTNLLNDIQDYDLLRDPLQVRSQYDDNQTLRLGSITIPQGTLYQYGSTAYTDNLLVFWAPTARFTSNDVGRVLTITRSTFPANNTSVTIAKVLSPTSVLTAPPLIADDPGQLTWTVTTAVLLPPGQETIQVLSGNLTPITPGWTLNDGNTSFEVVSRVLLAGAVEKFGTDGYIDSNGLFNSPSASFSLSDTFKPISITGSTLFPFTNNVRARITKVISNTTSIYSAQAALSVETLYNGQPLPEYPALLPDQGPLDWAVYPIPQITISGSSPVITGTVQQSGFDLTILSIDGSTVKVTSPSANFSPSLIAVQSTSDPLITTYNSLVGNDASFTVDQVINSTVVNITPTTFPIVEINVVPLTNSGTSALTQVSLGGSATLLLPGSGSIFSADSISRVVILSGFVNSSNNGIFLITGYSSPTNITIANSNSITETANATWTEQTTIEISGLDLLAGYEVGINPVIETGTVLLVEDNSAAGTYTLNSIVDSTHFTVNQSIVNATGGTFAALFTSFPVTTTSPHTVTVTGFNLLATPPVGRTALFAAGSKVTLFGAVSGNFTINTIVDASNFTVTDSIVSSTGGFVVPLEQNLAWQLRAPTSIATLGSKDSLTGGLLTDITEVIAQPTSILALLAGDFGISIDTQETETRQRSWVSYVSQWIGIKGLPLSYEILGEISGFGVTVEQIYHIGENFLTIIPSLDLFVIGDPEGGRGGSKGSLTRGVSPNQFQIEFSDPTALFRASDIGSAIEIEDAANPLLNLTYFISDYIPPVVDSLGVIVTPAAVLFSLSDSSNRRSINPDGSDIPGLPSYPSYSLLPFVPDSNNGSIQWGLVNYYTDLPPLRPNFDEVREDELETIVNPAFPAPPHFAMDMFGWDPNWFASINLTINTVVPAGNGLFQLTVTGAADIIMKPSAFQLTDSSGTIFYIENPPNTFTVTPPPTLVVVSTTAPHTIEVNSNFDLTISPLVFAGSQITIEPGIQSPPGQDPAAGIYTLTGVTDSVYNIFLGAWVSHLTVASIVTSINGTIPLQYPVPMPGGQFQFYVSSAKAPLTGAAILTYGTYPYTNSSGVTTYVPGPDFSCGYCAASKVLVEITATSISSDPPPAQIRGFNRVLRRLAEVTPAHVELIPRYVLTLQATWNISGQFGNQSIINGVLIGPFTTYFDEFPTDNVPTDLIWFGQTRTQESYGITTTSAGPYTYNSLVYPVAPSSVQIYVNGVLVSIDNGAGVMTGATIASGTITYTSGAISITFTGAQMAGQLITILYN